MSAPVEILAGMTGKRMRYIADCFVEIDLVLKKETGCFIDIEDMLCDLRTWAVALDAIDGLRGGGA